MNIRVGDFIEFKPDYLAMVQRNYTGVPGASEFFAQKPYKVVKVYSSVCIIRCPNSLLNSGNWCMEKKDCIKVKGRDQGEIACKCNWQHCRKRTI
jgi:hypothetical protein